MKAYSETPLYKTNDSVKNQPKQREDSKLDEKFRKIIKNASGD
jgi:hypothetical protein